MFKLHMSGSKSDQEGEEVLDGLLADVDLDELLFSEQLAVRSAETEETIGSYAVKAEKGEDEDGQPYIIVHVQFGSTIDGVGSTVMCVATVRPESLTTISQEHTEILTYGDFQYDKYTKIIREKDCYRIIQRISRPEAVTEVKDQSIPLDEVKDFIGDGANILVLRALAKRKLESEVTLSALNGDSELVPVVYYPVLLDQEVQSQHEPLFGIGRRTQATNGTHDESIFVFTADGHLHTGILTRSSIYITNDVGDGSVMRSIAPQTGAAIESGLDPFGFLSQESISNILNILDSAGTDDLRAQGSLPFRKALSKIQEEAEDATASRVNEVSEICDRNEIGAVQDDSDHNESALEPPEDASDIPNGHGIEQIHIEALQEAERRLSDCSLPPISNGPLSARSTEDAHKIVSRLNSILDAFSDEDGGDEKQPFSARLNPDAYDEDAEDVEDGPGLGPAAGPAEADVPQGSPTEQVEPEPEPAEDPAQAVEDAPAGQKAADASAPWTPDTEVALRSDCEKYISAHPELKSLLCQFVQAVLIAKPEDITWFGATYFKIISEARKPQRRSWKNEDGSDKDSAIE